jgi:hypothetical protein
MHFGTKYLFRLGQFLIQPMMEGLTSAFVWGAVPMALATVYSLAHALSRWYALNKRVLR